MGPCIVQRKLLLIGQNLHLHPSLQHYADMFVEHFLQALAAYQVTVEHDYCSLVMVSGGHKHPLLQGVLQACPVEDEDIRLTKADFLNIREELIGRK